MGRAIVKALAKAPLQWRTIYALSRSQKEDYLAQVKHAHLDLLTKPEEIPEELKGVEAEYVFFSAYVQKATEQENCDTNGQILNNFLSALSLAGTVQPLKRIVLTLGAKQYGLHLGPTKLPMEETDPRTDTADRPMTVL